MQEPRLVSSRATSTNLGFQGQACVLLVDGAILSRIATVQEVATVKL